jgi:hypothetical protein
MTHAVGHDALVAILIYKVLSYLIDIINEKYTNIWWHISTTERVSEEFKVDDGVRQGCISSLLLFNCFMDKILRETGDDIWKMGLQLQRCQECIRIEERGFPEPKCQQENQTTFIPSNGDVCSPLRSRDVGSDSTGFEKTQCFPCR